MFFPVVSCGYTLYIQLRGAVGFYPAGPELFAYIDLGELNVAVISDDLIRH